MYKKRKIYALNKIAYILAHNVEPIEIGLDEESDFVYYVFDTSNEIYDIINKYKEDEFINKFINSYSNVIKEIKSIKRGEKHGI